MSWTQDPPVFAAYLRDRRRTPRLEVLGQVQGYVASLGAKMITLDLSEGGFGAETAFPMAVGTVHLFRFTAEDGTAALVRARVAYCRRDTNEDGTPRYLSGLEFVDMPGSIAKLLDSVSGALSFDFE